MYKQILFVFITILPILTNAQNLLQIKNVAIVDIKAGKIIRDKVILIKGNRIISVNNKAPIPHGAVVFDAKGKYIIPGLWDMHAHTLTDQRYKYSFPLLIANGITGVREMGSNLDVEEINQIRKDIDEGKMLGPRLGALTYKILDGPGTRLGVALAVDNVQYARNVVMSFKQQGADFIKPYNLLSAEVYKAIADEAAKQHIPVEGHVPFSMTATEVSDLKQKTIEHNFDILVSCSSNETELRKTIQQQTWGQAEAKAAITYDKEKAKKLFARFVQNGTWTCPTIIFYKPIWLYASETEAFKDSLLKYIPKSQVESWHLTFQRLRQNTIEEYRTRHYEMRSIIVKEMYSAGVPILAGTDTGSPLAIPGFSLHDELQALVDAGLSNIEALKTATVNPAKFLGKEADFGTVQAGKIADLVLLDGNPLEKISNTKRINAVIVNGRLLQLNDLHALLNQVIELVKNSDR